MYLLYFSLQVQYNLNGSNTDGSFTMDDSYFIMGLYVESTH